MSSRPPLAVLLAVALLAGSALAHAADPPRMPLPAVPPPPPEMAPLDAAIEPQVTIRTEGSDTVEEFRLQGRVYMMKVTPRHGVPYYLIDERGEGQFVRRDTLDGRLLVPLWVIKQF